MRLHPFSTTLDALLLITTLLFFSCARPSTDNESPPPDQPAEIAKTIEAPEPLRYTVPGDVPVKRFFVFMDSLIAGLDTTLSYPVSEHVLVRNNPWLIDTLVNTDYYRLMARGIFNEDPQSLLALRKGDVLTIPDSMQAERLNKQLASTVLDLNIPEFTLRVIENDSIRHAFTVRVGRNEKKFLAMAGREVDLRTKTGKGKIVRINRDPLFINPADNKRYYTTKRDDGRITGLPGIPWLEPELDGYRFGQLIHPTTNPETLGRAYSNGCIGMGEGDMWRLYYHAPEGTPIVVRYDLEVANDRGETIRLRNIYPGYETQVKRDEIIAATTAALDSTGQATPVCDCGSIRQ